MSKRRQERTGNISELFAGLKDQGVVKPVETEDALALAPETAASPPRSRLPVAQIQPPPENFFQSIRPTGLDEAHVQDLAESIDALGLIEPLSVDLDGTLLCGAHRLRAIEILLEQGRGQRFQAEGVPVEVQPFRFDEDPERAFRVAITENEKRRDYTQPEVKAIADRLIGLGYRDEPGRPAQGQKALRPALSLVLGKSLRQMRRYLNTAKELIETQPAKTWICPRFF